MKRPAFRLPAARTLALAALLGSCAARANTEKDVLPGGNDLDATSSYAGNTLPSPTSDLTFIAIYGNTTFTLNTAGLNIGTLNDLDTTQALTISSSRTLTLLGGLDSVSGGASNDLLYLASGASLTYGGTGTIMIAANGNFDLAGTAQAAINVAIQGNALAKTGTGTLTLTGANTFNGGTTFAAGVLNAGSAGALGNNGTLSFTGGTLQYSAANQTDYSGRFSTAANQLYNVDTNGQNVTFAGALTSNNGTLTKSGAGTLTLTGTNTYTGATTLAGGVLNAGSAGALSTGTISLTGGTLQYSAANATDYSGRFSAAANQAYNIDTNGRNVTFATGLISSGGTLTKLGTGTLTLTGASTYTGATTVSAGTLAIGNGGSVTAGNNQLTVDGTSASPANLNLDGTGALFLGSAIIGKNGVGTFNQTGGTFTVSGGYLALGYVSGSGTYTLGGTGTLSTGIAIVGNAGTGIFTQTGGSFTTNGNNLELGYDPGGSGTYNLSGGTLTTTRTQVSDFNNTSVFTQSGGTHTTGTLSLSGNSTSSVGTYNLNGGVLSAGAVTSGDNGVRGTSTFNFNGGTLQASASTTGFLQGVTTANVRAGGAFFDTQGFNVTVAQPLLHDTTNNAPATDGGLTKLGAGTLTLTGANAYTGTTTISAGTLQVGNGGTTGSLGTGDIVDNNTLVFDRADAVTLPNAIGGGGNFVQAGTGTLTLTGSSVRSGNTTVTAGTLAIGNGGSITGGAPGLVTINGDNGSALTVDGSGTTPANLTLGGNGNLYFNYAVVGGKGTGNFTQTGGSFVVQPYDGVNSLFVGNGAGSTGTYTLGGTGSLSTHTTFVGNGGTGTFTQNGGAFTTGGYNLVLGNNAGSSGTYGLNGGTLNVGLVQGGSGTSTFNFNGGTLQAGTSNPGFFQNLTTANVRAGGALFDTQGFDVTVAQPLLHDTTNNAPATDGGLTKLGAGALTLAGTNSYTGTTTISAGTLQVGGGGTAGTLGSGNVVDNAALVFDRADNVTVANAIGGTGSLTQVGTGTVTLTGASTYAGTTVVSAGTLAVVSGGSLTGGGNLTVDGTSASPAAFNLGGTGALSTGRADIGSNGTGTVTQTGSTFTINGNYFNVGVNAGSNGTYNLSGTGSLSVNNINVGYAGTGAFNQTGGTVTTNGDDLFIGSAAGGSGTYSLGGTGTLSAAQAFVGTSGAGTFNQAGGTFNLGSSLLVGVNGGSNGTYNLSGGNLSTTGGSVGYGGTGTFTQTGGTFNTNDNDYYIGFYGGSNGTYNLGGTGSLSTGTLHVGEQSSGAFNLSGGSLSTATALVGNDGTGIFTQTGGSFTTNDNTLFLGRNSDGIGTYNLGAGSVVTGTGPTYVGYSGNGTLNLSGTGSLSTSTVVLGNNPGSAGTVNQTGGILNTNGSPLFLTYDIGNATYNLGGGTLAVGVVGGGAGTSTFNFNGGTLQASGSTTGFLQGVTTANVQAGGAVFDTQSYNDTVAQPLLHDTTAGAPATDGGLTKLGAGTLTLTGANAYTGTTTISAGTLQVGNGGTAGTLGSGNVADNGALVFDRADAVTLPNAIGGTGSLTQTGIGTLTLSGANTFTGPVTINAGTIAVASESNLGGGSLVSVNGASQLLFTGSATLSRTYDLNLSTLANTGGNTLTFASGTVVNGGYLAGAGTDALGGGSVLNSVTTLIGSTLSQTDGGTATLNNTTVRGALNQTGGTLALNNALVLGSGQVSVGGTVNAVGTEIQGVTTINSGGTLNAVGTSLYLTGGSRTVVNAGGTLAAGAATLELNGSQLVNNGLQTGVLDVNFGSVAKGTGTFGRVTVGDGGQFGTNAFVGGQGANSTWLMETKAALNGPVLSAAPGTTKVTSLALGSGGIFALRVQDALGAAGVGYDLTHASDTLDLKGGTTPGTQITIRLGSLNGNGAAGPALNFDPAQSYSFILVQADGGITGYQPGEFTVDTSSFQNNTNGGTFTVDRQGNQLLLDYAAVPEPGTAALLLLGGFGTACALRRRAAARA